MALVKATLKQAIYNGFYNIFTDQSKKSTSGDEQEDPDVIIKRIANEMAVVVSDAVDTYIKSGDVIVGPTEIQVISTSPGTPSTVTPLNPAKIE